MGTFLPEEYWENVRVVMTIIIVIGISATVIVNMPTHPEQIPSTSPVFVATTKEKRFCRYCGAQNKTDADFCERCGKKIG